MMLEFVLKRKVMEGHTKETRPNITYAAIQEATQKRMKKIEERLKKLNIEKIIDKMRRNSELLWSN